MSERDPNGGAGAAELPAPSAHPSGEADAAEVETTGAGSGNSGSGNSGSSKSGSSTSAPAAAGAAPASAVPSASDPPGTTPGQEISAKLELLGAVALLSVTAAVRMLEAKGGPASPEKQRELAEVRRKLQTSMTALDQHVAAGGIPGIDLDGLRSKVAHALETLDRSASTLEQPPS